MFAARLANGLGPETLAETLASTRQLPAALDRLAANGSPGNTGGSGA